MLMDHGYYVFCSQDSAGESTIKDPSLDPLLSSHHLLDVSMLYWTNCLGLEFIQKYCQCKTKMLSLLCLKFPVSHI